MSICDHGKTAPDEVLDDLHRSQAGMRDGVEISRHKCPECAYQRGYEFGLKYSIPPAGSARCRATGQSAPETIMMELPKSQGRLGRHKCAICAMHDGFTAGRAAAPVPVSAG